VRRAGRRHRPPAAAPLRSARLAGALRNSLCATRAAQTAAVRMLTKRFALPTSLALLRRCLHGRPVAHTAHREADISSGGAGRPRQAPDHHACCKAVGGAVGAPLRRRAPQESRVAPAKPEKRRSDFSTGAFSAHWENRPVASPRFRGAQGTPKRSVGAPQRRAHSPTHSLARGTCQKKPRSARLAILSAAGAAVETAAAQKKLKLVPWGSSPG
jgi:hypothetical protein